MTTTHDPAVPSSAEPPVHLGANEGAPTEAPADLDGLMATMRHLRNARSRIAELELTAERERERIRRDLEAVDHWLAQETKDDRGRVLQLEENCAAYLMLWLAENPNGKKSITTPYGRVESRDAGEKINWPKDDAPLLGWAADHGWVRSRTVESIDKAAIRAACRPLGGRLVTPDGETVPLVSVEQRGRSVTVDVS